jgi:hypothetical protein
MGNLSPPGVLFKKTVQFQGKLFSSTFLQAAVASPILGSDFLKKFKVTVSPEISQIQFACSAAASPAIFCLQRPCPPTQYFQQPRPVDPRPSFKKIPDSLPDDVKTVLQKFPLYFAHRGSEADT